METAQAAVLTDESTAAATIAAEAKKPGVIEQAMAGLRSKAALNAEIAQIKTERDNLITERDTLSARVKELETQVTSYQSDHARLETAIKEAAEEKQTVDEAAASKIVQAGIPTAELPAAGGDAQDTADSLRDKLAAEKNPKERFRIQKRIDSLESATA